MKNPTQLFKVAETISRFNLTFRHKEKFAGEISSLLHY